ncbi:MAG: hypothetical protein HOF99_07065, partial [Rhodospirillaceae bacterium]|nr:hypothetical protein [Rhodospirillaceae bacterium]
MVDAEQKFELGSDSDSRDTAAAFHNRVNLLLFLIAFAVCLSLGLTVWSAIKQDQITKVENLSLARSALTTDQQTLLRIIKDYSVWGDAYENLSLNPDREWWLENLQNDLHDNFGVVFTAAYNARDQIVFHQDFTETGRLDADDFRVSEIQEFLNSIRAGYGASGGARTSFVKVNERVYLIAGNVVQPFEAEDKPDPDTVLYDGTILLFFQAIDESFTAGLEANFLLPQLHLEDEVHSHGWSGIGKGELSIPLQAPSGKDLVYLKWTPEWPSHAILAFVVPPILLVVVGILFFAAFATRTLKRALTTIVQSRDEAIAAGKVKASLLANVSHELRTPLNGIIGFSDLILTSDLEPDEVRQYSKLIKESGNHLNSVVEDVLSMTEIESGSMQLSEDVFDLTECVRDCFNLLKIRAKLANISLQLSPDIAQVSINADESKLRQIVTNLVNNAIKFSPPNSIVSVDVALADNQVEILVRDEGIGIHSDDIEKILLPFGQVDTALSRRYEGTGLGLPIVVSLVELHGGNLAIDSEPDLGTTMIVSLPADRVVDMP